MLPPRLGPRGEGWLVGQIVLFWGLAAAGVSSLAGRGSWTGAAVVALIVGVALMSAGLVVIIRGIRDLGRSMTPLPQPTPDSELVVDGIYRHVRHPIYSGLVLAAVGWSVLTLSAWAVGLTLALLVWLDLKARREEAWLVERHAGYSEYRTRTRKFVPLLY